MEAEAGNDLGNQEQMKHCPPSPRVKVTLEWEVKWGLERCGDLSPKVSFSLLKLWSQTPIQWPLGDLSIDRK